MHKYHFSDALSYSFEQMAEMHNSSFSGYFIPAIMTAAQVADFWRLNQIDATRCVIMHDEHDAFVGMARMGTRGARGWCGGFGIVPEFRGTGASKLLAAQMVNVARTSGLAQIQLEVLNQNIPAIKIYEGVGFTKQRRLFGLEIATDALPAGTPVPTRSGTLAELLRSVKENPIRPYWGFELPGMLTQRAEILAVPGLDGQLNTFVTTRKDSIIRIQVAHLQHVLTDSAFSALLRSVATNATTVHVFNEPEDSPHLQRYFNLGFTEFSRNTKCYCAYRVGLPLGQ